MKSEEGEGPRARRRPTRVPRRLPLRLNDAEMAARHGEDRKFVWSLARAFELLRAFRPGQGPLGNAELSTRTGLPKATVTRLTYTLTQLGYLAQDERDGRYSPAPALVSLAYPVLANIGVRQMAQDHMQALADHAGASVAISAPDGDAMIYVAACSAPAVDALLLDIGSRVDMARSATGRAYLWALEPEAREAMFAHFEAREGEGWPALRERIEACFGQIEARGFCCVDREWRDDVRAAAAPIRDPDGRVRLVMNVGGPAFALGEAAMEEDLGPRLVHLVRQVERMQGVR